MRSHLGPPGIGGMDAENDTMVMVLFTFLDVN